jgi:MFS family permease
MTQTTDQTQYVSPIATLFIVCTIQFIVPFLVSSVSVALPSIGRNFHASAFQLSLTQTAHVLAVVSLLLPAGRFADIHGRKRIFITGTIVLTLTTLFLGMARSIEVFIVLRFCQGAGSAMIFSTSVAILTAVIPSERRGRAMGIIIANVYIGMTAGPTVAGFIITQLNWRWVFFLILPFQLMALGLTLTRLKGEWTSHKGEYFDWIGMLVFMVSLLFLVSGVTQVTKLGIAKWMALGGLIGMGIFLKFEQGTRFPLLDFHLIKTNLAFTFSNIATFINYAASFSIPFFFSLYLQYVKGFTPQATGCILMAQPAVQALIAPFAGRLSDNYPPSRIATMGMGLCSAGLLAAATIDAHASMYHIVVVIMLLGMGFGLFASPNMTAIMGSVEPQDYGTASSMISTMRSFGMLSSTVIIALIFSFYLGDQSVTRENTPAFIHSMRTSLILFSGMSLLGVVFSMAKGRLATSIEAKPK